MKLGLVTQYDESIYGRPSSPQSIIPGEDEGPTGHYLSYMEFTVDEFLNNEHQHLFSQMKQRDPNASFELINTYERGEYELAIIKTTGLRIFQRKWRRRHRRGRSRAFSA
jgi:hypothetical protein